MKKNLLLIAAFLVFNFNAFSQCIHHISYPIFYPYYTDTVDYCQTVSIRVTNYSGINGILFAENGGGGYFSMGNFPNNSSFYDTLYRSNGDMNFDYKLYFCDPSAPGNGCYQDTSNPVIIIHFVTIASAVNHKLSEDIDKIVQNFSMNKVDVYLDHPSSIDIYDLNGKLIKNYFLKNGSLDLSSYSPGIYFIVVNKRERIKLIKN